MTPMDAVGNELEKGDYVHIQQGALGALTGHITEIIPGGLVTGTRGNQQQVTPTRVRIVLEYDMMVNPQQPTLPHVHKCYDPRKGEKKGKSSSFLS